MTETTETTETPADAAAAAIEAAEVRLIEQAIRTGYDVGRVAGDELAGALSVDMSRLDPAFQESMRLEALHRAYSGIKTIEANLIAEGVREDTAIVFRVAAGAAMLTRVHLADITMKAGGEVH